MIQKSDAESIAVKLKAEVIPGRKHQWATFTLEDRAYKFSIRHGSKSDHSHRMCCNFQKSARERLVGSTRLRLMQPLRTAC